MSKKEKSTTEKDEITPEQKAALALRKKRLGGLKALAETVISIFTSWNSSEEAKEKDGLEFAKKYSNTLDQANYKFVAHKQYFVEFYGKHVSEFRIDVDDVKIDKVREVIENWLSKSVQFHLGDDKPKYAAKNNILRISKAYAIASLIRENIESRCNGKSVEKDNARRNRFEYKLADKLILCLFNVFMLCFDPETSRSDYEFCKAVFDCVNRSLNGEKKKKTKKKKGSDESSESSSEEEDEDVGPMAGFQKIFQYVGKNKGIIEKTKKHFADIQKDAEGNKKEPSIDEMFDSMSTSFKELMPDIKQMGEEMGIVPNEKDKKKKPKDDDSSSETESDSESE